MNKTLCIYHGNCSDGFAAAWVVRLALGEGSVEFHAGVHQDPPPSVRGRDVVMVDFSYKRDVLAEMLGDAASIGIIDHHATAKDEIDATERLAIECGLTGWWYRFDLKRSGCGIAWDHFFQGKRRPWLINALEDRDLWRFHVDGSKEAHAVVTSWPWDFQKFDELVDADPKDIIREGSAILRKHDQDIENLLPIVRRRMTIGGHDVPVAGLPIVFTSSAGHLMAQGEPFAACYWDTPSGRVFSLRSADDGIDVSEIAKSYGGGGHKHASGFRVALADLAAMGMQ